MTGEQELHQQLAEAENTIRMLRKALASALIRTEGTGSVSIDALSDAPADSEDERAWVNDGPSGTGIQEREPGQLRESPPAYPNRGGSADDCGARDPHAAQERIIEALALTQTIIRAAPFGINVYRDSGECVLANEAAGQIVGATHNELLAQNFRHTPSWQESGLRAAADEALVSGTERREEIHVVTSFGREVWLDCRLIPFGLGDDRYLLLIVDDITERNRMQELLIRHEKLVMLGKLAGGISHELRNPLGAIKNSAYYLGLLLEGESPAMRESPEIQEVLETMNSEVARAERTIANLLDFVRTSPPVRCPVYLAEVVASALGRLAIPPTVASVVNLPESLPPLLADPDQLDQAMVNLIANAIQAMPQGGTLTLTGRHNPRQRAVVLTVADTGVGIPRENLDVIFEPLFTTKAQGIGLGLALVKLVVETHGGTITVDSKVGTGTTFTIEIPTGLNS